MQPYMSLFSLFSASNTTIHPETQNNNKNGARCCVCSIGRVPWLFHDCSMPDIKLKLQVHVESKPHATTPKYPKDRKIRSKNKVWNNLSGAPMLDIQSRYRYSYSLSPYVFQLSQDIALYPSNSGQTNQTRGATVSIAAQPALWRQSRYRAQSQQ